MAHHPQPLAPLNQIFVVSLAWFGLYGFSLYLLGIFGRLNQVNVAFMTLIPLVLYLRLSVRLLQRLPSFSRLETILVLLLAVQFCLYLLGVYVPETGFDAIWYHLPEAQIYASTGLIAKIPSLLYSTMPRLGEMFFTAAFFTHSLAVVKIVSFMFFCLLSLVSYLLSQFYLSRPHSLLVTLTVNSLYVVSWQASSAYIDLPRAVFELGALLCLLIMFSKLTIQPSNHKTIAIWLFLSSLLMGFALSVKMHSFIGLFALSVFLVMSLRTLRFSVIRCILYTAYFILFALLVASPWYLDNYLSSGHPFYPTNLPAKQLDQLTHAGAASLPDWLSQRLNRLPLLFWDLGTQPHHQLSPIILILFPVFIWRLKWLLRVPKIKPLILMSLISIYVWWFLPPAESRYLLPALPPLIILLFYAVFSLSSNHLAIKKLAIVFVFISLALNFALRAAASQKYLPVIFGRQTPDSYIQSQTTPFNRDIIDKFYSGFWQNFRY